MSRVNIKEQMLNLVLLFLVQLPLVHRITLFDKAFGFFYVGFLLLLPRTMSRSNLMVIGFFIGLVVDVFTNTPGIHTSACIGVMFIRNFWLNVVNDYSQELINLNAGTLKKSGLLYFLFPLVFVHHFLIFVIEHGGFHLFGMVLGKVVFSAIFSTTVILIINLTITPTSGRA